MSLGVSDVSQDVLVQLCVASGWDTGTGSDGNTKHKGLASFSASNAGIQTVVWSHETIL